MNFYSMSFSQAVGEYTRTAPDKRRRALMRFSERMRNCAAVQEELTRWHIQLEPNLIDISGRTLKPEEIRQGVSTPNIVIRNHLFSY